MTTTTTTTTTAPTSTQQRILDAYNNHGPSATLTQLAQEAGCSVAHVHRTLAKIGVSKRPRRALLNTAIMRSLHVQQGMIGQFINALPKGVFDAVVVEAARKREPLLNTLTRMTSNGSLRITLTRDE